MGGVSMMDTSSRFFTDVASLMKAIEVMADACSLTCEWHADDNATPCTDMKKKVLYLPKPKAKWGVHDRTMWRAKVMHEIGHHQPEQEAMTALMDRENLSYGGKVGIAINGIDDIWQEMTFSREYVGVANALDYLQGNLARDGAKAVRSAGDKYDPFMVDLLRFAYECRAHWQPNVSMAVSDWSDLGDVDKWTHLIDRVNGIADHPTPAEELWAIVQEMFEADGEDANDEEHKRGEESGEGEPDEGSGENSSDSSDGGGRSGDEEGDAPSKIAQDYEELMGHVHREPGEPVPEPAGPTEISYRHRRRKDYDPYPLDNFTTGYPDGKPRGAQLHDIKEVYNNNLHVSRQIMRYFQSVSQQSREYQLKRGRLTAKHLTRGSMGDPRIFNKKAPRIDTNADVYLLCDASGSMAWDRYPPMCAAVTALTEALDAAKVPNRVAAFTEWGETCYHWDIKKWDERCTPDKMIDRFAAVDLLQNADGDNVMYAYRELLARDSKRKILIVLSDGQPSCDRDGDAYTYLKSVCSDIEKSGLVELYAVGIQTNDVKDFYSDYTVLNSPQEIEKCITEVVKRKIIGV